MRVRLAVSLVSSLVLLSCSSKSSSSAADAGDTSGTFTCGNGTIKGTVQLQDPTNLGPVEGSSLSAPGCTTVQTDDRGFANVATDPGFAIKIDAKKDGYITEHAEVSILHDNFQASADQYPVSAKGTVLAGWTDANGYIVFTVAGDSSDGGPCSTHDGVTVSIKDHPELKTVYLKDATTPDPTLTATGTLGIGLIGPVPPGSYQLTGGKTGCTIVPLKTANFQFAQTLTVLAGVLTGQETMLQAQ